MNCRLVIQSCIRRASIREIWWKCKDSNWPDCPFPIEVISPPEPHDVGWNANLINRLKTLNEEFILLMLDDNFIEPGPWTQNMADVIEYMTEHDDIGMIKLQAGGAAAPELEVPSWSRIREYDRRHHPFKRTNLIPTMYRREWLLRLSTAVLRHCGISADKGRQGAIEFEVTGTLLTEDAMRWPERMLGIHRPEPGGGGGDSLLCCMSNDAVVEGKMRNAPDLRKLCEGVAGIEAFL